MITAVSIDPHFSSVKSEVKVEGHKYNYLPASSVMPLNSPLFDASGAPTSHDSSIMVIILILGYYDRQDSPSYCDVVDLLDPTMKTIRLYVTSAWGPIIRSIYPEKRQPLALSCFVSQHLFDSASHSFPLSLSLQLQSSVYLVTAGPIPLSERSDRSRRGEDYRDAGQFLLQVPPLRPVHADAEAAPVPLRRQPLPPLSVTHAHIGGSRAPTPVAQAAPPVAAAPTRPVPHTLLRLLEQRVILSVSSVPKGIRQHVTLQEPNSAGYLVPKLRDYMRPAATASLLELVLSFLPPCCWVIACSAWPPCRFASPLRPAVVHFAPAVTCGLLQDVRIADPDVGALRAFLSSEAVAPHRPTAGRSAALSRATPGVLARSKTPRAAGGGAAASRVSVSVHRHFLKVVVSYPKSHRGASILHAHLVTCGGETIACALSRLMIASQAFDISGKVVLQTNDYNGAESTRGRLWPVSVERRIIEDLHGSRDSFEASIRMLSSLRASGDMGTVFPLARLTELVVFLRSHGWVCPTPAMLAECTLEARDCLINCEIHPARSRSPAEGDVSMVIRGPNVLVFVPQLAPEVKKDRAPTIAVKSLRALHENLNGLASAITLEHQQRAPAAMGMSDTAVWHRSIGRWKTGNASKSGLSDTGFPLGTGIGFDRNLHAFLFPVSAVKQVMSILSRAAVPADAVPPVWKPRPDSTYERLNCLYLRPICTQYAQWLMHLKYSTSLLQGIPRCTELVPPSSETWVIVQRSAMTTLRSIFYPMWFAPNCGNVTAAEREKKVRNCVILYDLAVIVAARQLRAVPMRVQDLFADKRSDKNTSAVPVGGPPVAPHSSVGGLTVPSVSRAAAGPLGVSSSLSAGPSRRWWQKKRPVTQYGIGLDNLVDLTATDKPANGEPAEGTYIQPSRPRRRRDRNQTAADVEIIYGEASSESPCSGAETSEPEDAEETVLDHEGNAIDLPRPFMKQLVQQSSKSSTFCALCHVDVCADSASAVSVEALWRRIQYNRGEIESFDLLSTEQLNVVSSALQSSSRSVTPLVSSKPREFSAVVRALLTPMISGLRVRAGRSGALFTANVHVLCVLCNPDLVLDTGDAVELPSPEEIQPQDCESGSEDSDTDSPVAKLITWTAIDNSRSSSDIAAAAKYSERAVRHLLRYPLAHLKKVVQRSLSGSGDCTGDKCFLCGSFRAHTMCYHETHRLNGDDHFATENYHALCAMIAPFLVKISVAEVVPEAEGRIISLGGDSELWGRGFVCPEHAASFCTQHGLARYAMKLFGADRKALAALGISTDAPPKSKKRKELCVTPVGVDQQLVCAFPSPKKELVCPSVSSSPSGTPSCFHSLSNSLALKRLCANTSLAKLEFPPESGFTVREALGHLDVNSLATGPLADGVAKPIEKLKREASDPIAVGFVEGSQPEP